jgi:hypothetical protein
MRGCGFLLNDIHLEAIIVIGGKGYYCTVINKSYNRLKTPLEKSKRNINYILIYEHINNFIFLFYSILFITASAGM